MARRPEQRCAVTTPQMDWLDDQRRKRAVSSDDIVTRLRSENRMVLAPFHMSDAADEIERLRALGDALADAAIRQQWSRLDVAVAAWHEARRG